MMNILKRRKYKAWLFATLEKGALSRQEIDLILRGQLLLPARNRDAGLMQECAAALTMDDSSASESQRRVWNMISKDVEQMKREAAQQKAVRKRVGLVIVMVLVLALAAAGLAAALSPQVFSFLWGQDTPNAYVQKDAAGLVKTDLGRIEREHLVITILEAAYDGQELRVVYTVRDKGAQRLYTYEDEALLYAAAQEDHLGVICDWVTINGVDEMLSDCGTNPGKENGELFYYIQSLMQDQEVVPVGDFTVGLPLDKDMTGERPRSVAPPELTFTLNAEEAMKLVRTAEHTEATVNGARFVLTNGTFTPVAGSLRLDVSGEEPDKVRQEAYDWGLEARLYTLDGVQVGEPPVTSFAHPDGLETPPAYLLMRIVPPDVWPEEMLLALPDKDGKPDTVKRIAIKLIQK